MSDTDTRSPAQIRAEIEQTRRDLGDTAAALAEKTDVKARAQEKVAGVKETISHVPSSDTVKRHPLPFAAIGAFAAGFVLGRFSSR
jgi:hypothetical protein